MYVYSALNVRPIPINYFNDSTLQDKPERVCVTATANHGRGSDVHLNTEALW